jgi:hypothetical protein
VDGLAVVSAHLVTFEIRTCRLLFFVISQSDVDCQDFAGDVPRRIGRVADDLLLGDLG